MSSDHDVRRALRELAEDAPPVSAIETASTMRRIRKARVARQCATAALSVTATAAVVVGAVTIASQPSEVAPDAQPPTRQPETVASQCPDAAATIGSMTIDGSPLVMTMTAAPPLSVSDGTPQISVVVTNNSNTVVSATTSVHPDVVLVRDGQVVTEPAGVRSVGVHVELAPGASHTFATPVSLAACQSGPGVEAPDKVPVSTTQGPVVEPGAYRLYATQTFLVRDAAHPDGYPLEVRGGPWEIVLR
jgi:hypothetical protein